jgi:hypothetical protein
MNFHSLIGYRFMEAATSTSNRRVGDVLKAAFSLHLHHVPRDFHVRMFTRRDVEHCFLCGLHSSENIPLFPLDSFARIYETEANASWH